MRWTKQRVRWASTAVLLAFFALAVTSLLGKTPTFDEQGFLVRGLGYVRGDNTHMRVGHPAGLNAWNALLLRHDPTVALPVDDPSWQTTDFHRPGELFMWEMGNSVEHVMFAARIMTVFLGMLLAAIVARWAAEMSTRPWVGLLVLVLVAFDPNVLAHTRLTTTDLGLTLGTAVAGYTLWRYLIQPSWQRALIAGIGFGLLANTKFTMGLFVPLFALVILLTWGYSLWQNRTSLQQPKRGDLRTGIHHSPFTIFQFTILFPTAAILTLWAMYGFDIGTLPAELPALPQLSGLTLPLAHHLEQLLDIGNRAQIGAPAFLLGDYRDTGWWQYFPIAFLTKTPLPTLILLLIATLTLLLRLRSPFTIHHSPFTINLLTLLIPALGYFALALTTTVNLGYRHLLPMWPFLWVLIGYGMAQSVGYKVQGAGFRGQGARPTTYYLLFTSYFLLPLWLILTAFAIHPHYLAYFNVLAGGPNNGWRVLVDSNLDWGQDLAGLAEWQRANGADTLWLSYFGEGRPDYYGLDYRGLDSFPPRLMNPYANPFYPADPAPGLYAISATNLQGVHFENHDQFAWFRAREPVAKIGYSIFLYDVPARGEPANLALPLGMDMSNLPPELHAPLATNDVRPSWYEASRSLLMPAQNGWLVSSRSETSFLGGVPDVSYTAVPRAETINSYVAQITATPPAPDSWLGDFDGLRLIRIDQKAVTGQDLFVHTFWQATAPDNGEPRRIFVHALDEQGEILAQSDVLDMLGWQTGDWLIQGHVLTFPEGVDPSTAVFQFRVGLYNPETGEQLGEPVHQGAIPARGTEGGKEQ